MEPNANRVIRWLDETELDEAALAVDPELSRMLDPFRLIRPLAFRCGRDRCNTRIAWWAITSQGNRITFAPERGRRKVRGVYLAEEPPWGRSFWQPTESLTSSAAELDYPGIPAHTRYGQDVEWALQEDSPVSVTANPDVKSGYPLRFTFTCPKCQAEYPLANSRMVQLHLRGIELGRGEVRPGPPNPPTA